ncbi:MAG TPA: cyclase family protein [Methanoregulaceae archaeon]|nr:cyclase family protein [Methanoregulaceae archaeon]
MERLKRSTDFIDVTREIVPGMTVYPGDTVPGFDRKDFGQYQITDLLLSTHSGTHIDAPAHYIQSGATIEKVPLEALIGECVVIDVSDVNGEICPEDVGDRAAGAARVLLRTGYRDDGPFDPHYTSPGPTSARLFTRLGVRCLGTDAPSIEKFGGSGEVHRELLGRGVAIIEFLDLDDVPEGVYLMIALPLRLGGLDGSPARVILCR